MKLFLDDQVDPLTVYGTTRMPIYGDKNWYIARNFDSFRYHVCKEADFPTVVSFDHSLDSEHHQNDATIRNLGPLRKIKPEERRAITDLIYGTLREKTGWHCAEFLVNYCLDKGIDLPICLVHSQVSPIGCDNILFELDKFYNKR